MGTLAAILLVGLVIRIVWLAFLSDMLSRFAFREDLPLPRAAKCVVVAVAISWALAFVIAVASPFGQLLWRFDTITIALDIAAPLLVFLWEWRSFNRHWTDDEDVAEVFE